ncbi:MAG: hypothetical protein JJT75_10165 [Opitutales bacterium]|nr:hypothetical protein [Opitutales bacterium]
MALFYPRILFCLFFLGLPCVSLLQGDDILYWGGSDDNRWTDEGWYDNADLTGDPIAWDLAWEDRDVVIPDGQTVNVNDDIVVRDLNVNLGAFVRLNGGSRVLEVRGFLNGLGTIVFTRQNNDEYGNLFVNSPEPQKILSTWEKNNIHSRIGVRIGEGAHITFQGKMDFGPIHGHGTRFWLEEDTHFIVGANAQINNQMDDLIRAQQFEVYGSGPTSIWEFHEDFNADFADPNVLVTEDPLPYAKTYDQPPDGSYVKPEGGLSTWRGAEGLTAITHNTANLPSIHKFTGPEDDPKKYTHHGLLNFDRGDPDYDGEPTTWIVRSNPQSYDGGIYFQRDWILQTEENLLFEGAWHQDVNIGFATRGTENLTFTKRGTADLILAGTQSYAFGTTFDLEEGRILFQTNPDIDSWPEAKSGNGWFTPDNGNHLNLTVHPGATAAFQPAPTSTDQYWLETETFDIYSATLEGTLHLELNEGRADAAEPVLAVADHLTFDSSGATLTVTFAPGFSPQAETDYLLLTAGSLNLPAEGINGDLPSGWTTEVDGNDLWLVPATATGFDAWVADHLDGTAETAPSDDPWGQGITNLERYALGYSATSLPAAADRPRAVRASGGGGETLFQFRRPLDAPDDVEYTVQISEDLTPESWSDIDPSQWTTTEDGDYEIISVELNGNGQSPDRLFARLLLSME